MHVEVHVPPLQIDPPTEPEQTVHALPPAPHALALVPGWHALSAQHPVHDVSSHAHAPLTQCWPLVHVPLMHRPLQPSLAPQSLPVQFGVHAPPVPQTFGVAAPQVCPMLQPPQSTVVPQRVFN
jgi:hypothetical protein